MPKTIYWIDDDTDIIDPVVAPLENAGYHIVRLRTATEALDAADQLRQAHLIILDIFLPPGQTDREFSRYSGVDILKDLRELYGVTTPVVVFSVVDPDKILQQLRILNATHFVRKPALPSELKACVEEVLEKEALGNESSAQP